jgi:hypothetical protein
MRERERERERESTNLGAMPNIWKDNEVFY